MVAGRIADQGSPAELKRKHDATTLQDVFIRLAETPLTAAKGAP
jgi:hypothetical protein